MIDWISVNIPLKHRCIKAGHFLLFDADGVILSDKPVSKLFEGSHESKITLRSQGIIDNGFASEIFLSGNPSKFLQGHNVFGHDGLFDLLRACLIEISDSANLGIEPLSIVAACHGGIVSRIDFTKSIQFENRTQVRSYIKQVSQLAHTRSGRPMQKKWTLAFQASSRRWSCIVYSKGDELESHKLPKSFIEKDFIHNEANTLVRVELRLKTLELRDLKLRHVYLLTSEKLNELYAEYIGRIQMSESLELSSDQIAGLSRTLKATYFQWKEGIDIAAEMSKPTFYRHCLELKKIGVDISIPFEESSVKNVVPLKTVIKGSPYVTPQAAFDKGLVFQPRAFKLAN